MEHSRPAYPKPSCALLTNPKESLEKVRRGLSKMEGKEVRDGSRTPTTAPATPSICGSSDADGRGSSSGSGVTAPHDEASTEIDGPAANSKVSKSSQNVVTHQEQQINVLRELARPCKLKDGAELANCQLKYPPSRPNSHAVCAGSLAAPDASSENRSNTPLRIRTDSSFEAHAAKHEAAEPRADETTGKQDAQGSDIRLSFGTTCFQKLLEQYRHRRSAFEKNCCKRYHRIVGSTMQKRRSDGPSRIVVGGQDEQKQPCRLSPSQAKARRNHDGEPAELTASSSGEEPMNRGAAGSRESLGTCDQADTQSKEGGLVRRPKGSGQRSFPYRQFHVHHFLPEPESKVGLLTHPTPAQFNKYPKARGVWFDPHRNLVRTCWKENGKARTMGFPVNKFGLEEARTLAVEYHHYKCPTDPLPDDLLSLVPRKPPHAYGWC